MVMEGFMRSKTVIILLMFGLTLFLQGCGTMKGVAKGATEGAKEDWEAIKKADSWMEENMW